MSNVETGKRKGLGIIEELVPKLNNHVERTKHKLHVSVRDRNGTTIEEDNIFVYDEAPVEKIEEKVNNIRIGSSMFSLEILALEKVADCEYELVLCV